MNEVYQTIQGDTWDIIAKKVYGNEKYLDYLMANNFPLPDYFVFPTGVAVSTPALPVSVQDDLLSWRKGVQM